MVLISMLLARGPGHPEGDVGARLELRAALTAQAHIDAAAYHADPRPWTTRRVEADGRIYAGELLLEESGWAIRRTGSEDDPLWASRSRSCGRATTRRCGRRTARN